MRLKDSKLYGARERGIKTRLILESIEQYFGHKEEVSLEEITIEHVMPQTLSEWWQNHLGEDGELTHDLYLHNIGNLTLTAYNTELSNYDFPAKKEIYKNSHLELNKYFDLVDKWHKEEIEKRADILSEVILKIWPYFGIKTMESKALKDVTGTTPIGLYILGQNFEVETWRDVLAHTLNTIMELEPEKFEILMQQFPNIIGKDKNKFRTTRQLRNGTYIEVNLPAQHIQKICHQAIETMDLTSDDWKVEVI